MDLDSPILIVDDEQEMRQAIVHTLEAAGITNTVQCDSCQNIMTTVAKHGPRIILLDLNMPVISGDEVLPEIIKSFPELIVIIVTGVNDVDMAVSCLKKGAYDYLLKPFDPERLLNCIRHAGQINELREEVSRMERRFLEKKLADPEAFAAIITGNEKMLGIFQLCESIAPGNQPVLITGETGTGKELLARAIHALSGRTGNFVAINIAELETNMLNASLFGHIRGAFTGANQDRQGLVEEAAGGTLFLDEIGDLERDAQIKLLRLLQEHEYLPVGSNKKRLSDFRVLAATHVDIDELVEKGRFRRDLYFRLTSHQIRIPPLRERLDDIGLLLDFFFESASREYGKKLPTYPPELETLLKTYHFPGNIRELRSMVYDAVARHHSRKLSLGAFREKIRKQRNLAYSYSTEQNSIIFPDILPSIKVCTDLLVEEALRRSENNQKVASEALGITQQALSKRVRKQRSAGD